MPAEALQLRVSSRRSALAGGLAALTPQIASAACLGKCPEDPAKAEARRAIQQGSGAKPPPTMAEMIEQSIAQKEATLGMSLSEDEKKQVEAKVRAAYPGIK